MYYAMPGSNALTSAQSQVRSMRYTSTAILYAGPYTYMGYIPGNETQTLVGGQPQCYCAFTFNPQVAPINTIGACYRAEISAGTTVSVALVGATPHTYISLHNYIGLTHAAHDLTKIGTLMLWE
jgi:hypothetical protein